MRLAPSFVRVLTVGSLLALAACATVPSATSPTGAARAPTRDDAARELNYISLERTRTESGAAPGPVYVLTLFADGRVIFEGHASVKSKGTFSKTIPREQAAAVFDRAESINLWERERRYDVERADRGGDSVIVRTASTEVPWDIVRARNRGRTIRIDGLFFAPAELIAFKRFVEATVGLDEWIGEPHEWQK